MSSIIVYMVAMSLIVAFALVLNPPFWVILPIALIVGLVIGIWDGRARSVGG